MNVFSTIIGVWIYPANIYLNCNILVIIYLLDVNNRNTRKRCEICSNLTIKTRYWCRSGEYIANFEHISHLFLVFLLLTLCKEMLTGMLQLDNHVVLHGCVPLQLFSGMSILLTVCRCYLLCNLSSQWEWQRWFRGLFHLLTTYLSDLPDII